MNRVAPWPCVIAAVSSVMVAAALAVAQPMTVQSGGVRVEAGGPPVSITVPGTGLEQVTAAMVMPAVEGVSVQLGPLTKGGRTFTFAAAPGARPGRDYRLGLVLGGKQTITPFTIEVVARSTATSGPPPAAMTRLPDSGAVGALRDPGGLSLSVPCGAAPVSIPAPTQAPAQAVPRLPTMTLPYREPLEVEVCATPGWASYSWFVWNEGVSGTSPADSDRWRIVVKPRPQEPGRAWRVEGSTFRTTVRVVVTVHGRFVAARQPEWTGAVDLPLVVTGIPPFPQIQSVWIDDPRPGTHPPRPNVGIVDPVLIANPERIDGEFYVDVRNLGARSPRFYMGNVEATILQRTRVGDVDRFKAKVARFLPGPLTMDLGDYRLDSGHLRRLAYWVLEGDAISGLLQSLNVVVGDPPGKASVTLFGQTQTFDVEGYRQGAIRVDVNDMRGRPPTVSVQPARDGDIDYTITVEFETDGRELIGGVLQTVDYWQCGSFQVAKNQCALDVGCFLGVIGERLRSAISCLDSRNWSTVSVPGPSVPLEGDLSAPRLQITTRIGPSDGSLVKRAFAANFTAGFSLSSGPLPIPIDVLRPQILKQVSDSLQKTLEKAGIGDRLVQGLQGLVGAVASGARINELVVMSGNRLYFDLDVPRPGR